MSVLLRLRTMRGLHCTRVEALIVNSNPFLRFCILYPKNEFTLLISDYQSTHSSCVCDRHRTMAANPLTLKAKNVSDIKKAQAADEEVAKMHRKPKSTSKPVAVNRNGNYTGDPLRRSKLEIVRANARQLKREWAKFRIDIPTEEYNAKFAAARQKEAQNKLYEQRLADAKSAAVSEKDDPLVPERQADRNKWVDEDMAEMASMSIEQVVGIQLWLDRIFRLGMDGMKHFGKAVRVCSALNSEAHKKVGIQTKAAEPDAKSTQTEQQTSPEEVHGKMFRPSTHDYTTCHPQKVWTVTLENALERLHSDFKLKISADDRDTILSETDIRGGSSVPAAVNKFSAMLYDKTIAKKSSGNKRLAAAGLLARLWHSELEKCFERSIPIGDM
jgi:hypothetical protein